MAISGWTIGEYGYRDPKHKTVYVIASDSIAKVELYVNDDLVGSCDTPQDTFVFHSRMSISQDRER